MTTYIIDYGSYFSWLDNKGNINTQCNRAADEKRCALTVACANTGNVFVDYKYVRKLTPKECFKLMGVKPSDYEKVTCSNAQKYKQAGNSIVTTVLMAIYSQLFENVDYKYYIEELLRELRSD
jgi:site-specific DNA-cytosine methylase